MASKKKGGKAFILSLSCREDINKHDYIPTTLYSKAPTTHLSGAPYEVYNGSSASNSGFVNNSHHDISLGGPSGKFVENN